MICHNIIFFTPGSVKKRACYIMEFVISLQVLAIMNQIKLILSHFIITLYIIFSCSHDFRGDEKKKPLSNIAIDYSN